MLTAHGQTRIDPYYWLRDDTRQEPEVLAHPEAENTYKETVLANTGNQQESLFREMVGRIQQADTTAPVKDGSYWDYMRFEKDKEYPIIARMRGKAGSRRRDSGRWEPPGRRPRLLQPGPLGGFERRALLSFAEDTVGRRQYTIRFSGSRS